MNAQEMARRFRYVKPNDDQVLSLETVRGHMWALGDLLDEELPECREKSLALTHLEQAQMWANAALVRPAA